MSLFEEKKGNIIQENFQAGRKKIYLRNKDKPESINVEHAYEALSYLKDKLNHYSEIENKIIMMLPQPERNEYLSKRTAELVGMLRRLEEKLSGTKIKPGLIPKLTNPLLTQVKTRVAHYGFSMKQQENIDKMLKDLDDELKDDKA
ncbi:MAG: hypothetical protein EPO62_05225 [Candidatus Nitrosotenuis sp.]|nr:MAG: hypothetical protein EPO62_05225 [Candidatus Nitrosotenuis sp.]